MPTIKNVELTKKANVYFEGKVTSRSFVDENGVKKSLGIMMPGEYTFGTNEDIDSCISAANEVMKNL